MRLSATIIGDLGRIMAEEVKAAEKAVTAGVGEAAEGLKTELRTQITNAGLGPRLARTWRSETFPNGQNSIRAAGLVWSKAPGIIRIYEDGATIRSTKGFFLAIPTAAAGRFGDGGRKITPAGWERRTGQRLRFVYRRNAASLLVADNMRARTGKRGGYARATAAAMRSGRGLVTVPIFILVPQVTFRKRLDVASAANRWQERLPSLVVGNWVDGR
ncbi:hypothetical protein IMF23_16330 [Chelatococcus daeguensis]|uniref:DUF6441 family protein n=1 Tax=Chelatococcus daeguensis TaxID=444444 RepID=UPI0007AB3894|nr:hypothetical protein AVW15_12270 [Chelatococcus daeguensis]MBM3085010.1 hypothetical protein [Chelatococcus daeguensis]